jgi:hypothetical protein
VNRHLHLTALVLALSSSAQPALAADPAPSAIPVAKDLTAVIALQGLPCGQVVSVTQKGENDYVATCQDGNRYHVLVDPSGRVVVQKQ